MKQVQDYYFHKAKKDGFPARSVYKLEEAQKKFRLLRLGDFVLDLGCQPGSWSICTAQIVGPQGLVVGVDLNPGSIQVKGGAPFHFVLGDIARESVLARAQSICPRFNVIVSDMAPKTTGNRWADQQHSLRLAWTVLEIVGPALRRGGHLYCKVFEGEDFKELVAETRRLFKTARVFKPKSSRAESREVFLLGRGFRG